MPDVTIEVPATGALPAYFSPAVGIDGPAPGVVVVHEAFGLNADIRDMADQFAARGFHAGGCRGFPAGRRSAVWLPDP